MQIAENAIADGMSMEGNEFQESISAIIKERKPRKIIETGTYLGEGSTRVIADALKDKWRILDEKSDSPNRYWYLIEKLNGANIEQD